MKAIVVDSERFYHLYVEQNLTLGEVSQIMNIGRTRLNKHIAQNNIRKTPTQIQESIERISLNRYGTANPGRSEKANEKRKNTCLKKYGVENPLLSDEIKERVKQTCLDKYGVENPLKSVSVQTKAKNTMKQRYGVDSPLQSSEILKKTQQTNLEKYGNICPRKIPGINAKIKQTCIERYGVDNPAKSEEIKQKIRQICIQKFGASSFSHSELSERAQQVLSSAEALRDYIQETGYNTTLLLSEKLNIGRTTITSYLNLYDLWNLINRGASVYENEISKILDEWGVEHYKTKQILKPQEIDLYCSSSKVGIEFNGNWWHREEERGKKYHQAKTLKGETLGVQIYHIFEYEWNDDEQRQKILNHLKHLLLPTTCIYARQCEVKSISFAQKKDFLDKYHLQGNDTSSVYLGLFYDELLVSVMTFGKPRFSTRYEWELMRYCVLPDITVVGGASKLFKHFLNTSSGDILSYNNLAKTKGDLYKNLGFTLESTNAPSYVWWNNSTNEIFSRYQCQMKNEKQIMTDKGFYRIYDCGTRTWGYHRE